MTNGSITPTAPVDDAGGTSPVADRPVLRLSGISKRFGPVAALTDASLEVLPGEVHALLGENGAGKSTLMNVAAGSLTPDEGTIEVDGVRIDQMTPAEARARGLAIVRQHPALMPDLTVAENIAVALPALHAEHSSDRRAWMQAQLDKAGCRARLNDRVEDLSVAQRQLLELAKALAQDPRILILDEPTAPLGADMVDNMLDLVRRSAAAGTAVVYISHRLPEVRQIADRVTVMRDGAVRTTDFVDALTDDEILELIVGRSIEAAFPAKRPDAVGGAPTLRVSGLSGAAFSGVDLQVAPGEIVGIAGIAGNGQAEFLRSLAGLERATGDVELGGKVLKLGRPARARAAGVAYLPSDRHEEGLMMTMSIRENAGLGALSKYAKGGVVSGPAERRAVEGQREELRIRTDSIETPVSSLSGGNQQKVVLARAMLSEPKLILAEEPTQGVDAGARVEIYRILREAADRGIPVVVVSSDSLELEGLCDRVVVLSRGQVVDELVGDDVTEARMARSIVTATTLRHDDTPPPAADGALSPLQRVRAFASGDYGPAAILLVVIIALGVYTWSQNDRVISTFNLTSALTLLSALAFISFGQLIVIMTGGIDLSVGPLAGLLVVIASFFVVEGKGLGMVILGFLIMLAAAGAVGTINGSLIRLAGFSPIAATLAMYIALQGVSLILRPEQGGYIDEGISSAIQTSIGGIPVAFLVVVVVAILLEGGLRKRQWGLRLRGAGSREEAAHAAGVNVRATVVRAYVACSVLTFLGAIMLMAQLGVGDASQGTSYTLNTITAVVLGGASLFGGRGSFIGVLLGAFLIQQITNATTFLGLSQAWQYWFVGLLALLAAGIYTQARRAGRRA